MTAVEAGLEAAAGPVAGEVWCLSRGPSGWTVERAAHCWPGTSIRRSPSPAQSSSHTAP